MSETDNSTIVRAIYPPINVTEEKKRLMLVSPAESTFREVRPTGDGSGANKNNIIFTFDVPQDSNVDKKIYYYLKNCTFTFTCAGDPGNDSALKVINEGYDNIQNYILNYCIQTLTIKYNSEPLINQVRDFMGPMRYSSDLAKTLGNSGTNLFPDYLKDYNAVNGTGMYHPCSLGTPEAPHLANFTITRNDNLSTDPAVTSIATVSCDIVEPLMHPLLEQGDHQELGLENVNRMEINLIWSALADSSVWKHATPTGMTGAWNVSNFTFDDSALLVNFLTPPLRLKPSRLSHSYNYRNFQEFFDSKTLPVDGVLNSTSLTLPGFPRLSLIYYRIKATNTSPEYYMPIEGIQVSIGNRTVLNEADKHSLYHISKRNGINMPSKVWHADYVNPWHDGAGGTVASRGVGSILALTPNDYGTSQNMMAGIKEQITYQYKLRINNYTGAPITNGELVTIHIYDGMVTAGSDFRVYQMSGLFSKTQIGSFESYPQTMYPGSEISYLGGNIFTDSFKKIKNFVRQAEPYARDAYQIGKTLAPLAATAAPYLMGAGTDGESSGRRGRKKGNYLKLKM